MKYRVYPIRKVRERSYTLWVSKDDKTIVMDAEGEALLAAALEGCIVHLGDKLDEHRHAAGRGLPIYTDSEQDAIIKDMEQLEELGRKLKLEVS